MALDPDIRSLFIHRVRIHKFKEDTAYGEKVYQAAGDPWGAPKWFPARVEMGSLELTGEDTQVKDLRGRGHILILYDGNAPLLVDDKYELEDPFIPHEAPPIDVSPVFDESELAYWQATLGTRDRG